MWNHGGGGHEEVDRLTREHRKYCPQALDALCGTDNFDGLQSVKLLLVDEKHPYISSGSLTVVKCKDQSSLRSFEFLKSVRKT